ncbi:restriction endonuclease subunit S [Desulfonema ishimotonii]|uniref:Restriction endonuclease subunit S n=1 Tax=Desulfonema ishimotonii TaxID=45657 RepID=A0A401FWS0_9BACT|nr:restriction endonuclease subunit S [Desulfonema ishimotonii]GBC61389.1 restriction endonuclease subunit S [Desulfonema ishimotonii]
MGSEWTEITIGDLGKVITGKTPSTHDDANFGGHIPFVTPRDLNGTRKITKTERYLTEMGTKSIKNAVIPAHAVMISCIGSDMGKAAIASECCVTNQQINSIIVGKQFDHKYVYYNLSTRKDEIRGLAGGSAQPILNKRNFSQLDILLPPLPEQRAIAHILGSLDDKIELNRRMNETLEAMAQAMFKSWFVDFDPVIDNALAAGNEIPETLKEKAAVRKSLGDARKPLPEEIRNLFPSEFEYSDEMGWIPKGWEVKTLDELVDLIGGGTPKTSVIEYWNGNIPWFSVVDAPNVTDVFVIDTEKHITQLGLDKSSTKILPIGTTIVSARGTVGKCAMTGKPVAMNQSCYGVRGKSNISNTFVYYTIREKVTDLQRSGHGSVFNTITRDTFKTIQMPFGETDLTQELEKQIKPDFDRILANCHQIENLSNLRDTLLPKLLSGEIRIPEKGEV